MAGGLLSDVFKVSNDLFSGATDLGRIQRDSHTAANRHLVPSTKAGSRLEMAGLPRPKFLFGARFYTQSKNAPGVYTGGNTDDAVTFMLKYVDRPKMNFEVEELNQYNKPRLANTKVKFQDLTMRFHDTVDDRVLQLFQDYYHFYFGDGRKSNINDYRYDIISPEFVDNGNTGWGFKPNPNLNGDNQHFFSHIEIYHFFGGMYNTMTLVHPKLTMFDHDSNDYADGTTGAEIQMGVKFEGLYYSDSQTRVTPELAELFGITKELSDYMVLDQGNVGPFGGIGDLANIRSQFLDSAGIPVSLQRFVPNLPTPIQKTLNTVSGVNSALGTIGRWAHAASTGAARASAGSRSAGGSNNPNDPTQRAASAAGVPASTI